MKICSKCGKELPLSQFSWRNKSKGIYQSRCKDCQSLLDKEYYLSNATRRSSIRERAKRDKAEVKNFIKTYKECHPCIKCGESRCHVLDFHHINNDKEKEVSSITTWGLKRVQAEISKCVVLCSNCHRDFHWKETHDGITFQQYINSN